MYIHIYVYEIYMYIYCIHTYTSLKYIYICPICFGVEYKCNDLHWIYA